MARGCKFRGCPHDPRSGARGYCSAHYAQVIRGRPLAPIRERGRGGARIGGLTLSIEALEALAARGPTVYVAAREILEAWAKRVGNGKKG
jgi:hypothetical protein